VSVTVLSLQSHVVQGTVGNSIAVPVMRAMGVRAWGMPTALLSNHNGRSSVAGIPIDSEQIDAMVNALDSNGELKHVDAVLSGYLTPRTGPAVLRTVERLPCPPPRHDMGLRPRHGGHDPRRRAQGIRP